MPHFTKRGRQLPAPTQLLIDMSNFVVNYGVYIIGSFVVMAILIGLYYATPRGKLMIDTLLLKVPVIGKLLLHGALADFLLVAVHDVAQWFNCV